MNLGRRHMLLGMGIAAILPAFASRASGQEPAAPARGAAFAPPSGPMRFRRILIRELGLGAQITVTRDFAIEFARSGPDYEVGGHQIGAAVSAPDNLAALAQLERDRVENGVFPITLDHAGQIIIGPERDARNGRGSLRQALENALAQIQAASLSAEDILTMQEFAVGVSRAANEIVSILPTQLFSPGPQDISEEQLLTLPNGDHGTVRTHFSGVADAQCGILQEARREITTRLSGTSRRTAEMWTLSPL